ncbi:MAG: hypothetical protein ACXWYG_03980 [Aeromicrobium sp.]
MPPRSKTATSTPRLSEYALAFKFPNGIKKTVWTRVEAKGKELDLGFDWWQSQLGTVCLGYGDDGQYVATVGGIGLSIPRQVGKTYFVLATLVILCILFPGLQVVWTAHHLRTSTKTFTTLRGICRRKKVAPHIAIDGRGKPAIRSSNGEQEVVFRNGSKIMFGARSMGFGRGFDEIDVEVFDEAQILDSKALEDMVAATNQARHEHGALLFFMGTPPRPTDPSEAFSLRRAEALAGDAEDAIWLEIGADPESDPNDQKQYPKMNPSFPKRTPLNSILRLRKNLGDEDSWNREGRGIWDPVSSRGVIPGPSWLEREDTNSAAAGNLALGVEVGPDLAWASVALAGQRADGSWHFELDDDQHTRGRGVAWLVPHLQYLAANNPSIRSVVVDVAGPVAALLEQRNGRWFFKGTNLEVTPVKVAELGAGCANVLDGIVTGWLHHIGQPQFTAAALAAGKRPLGDTGMWVWSRKMAESDITPIQAGTLALIGARAQSQSVRKPTRTGRGRRVVTY